MLFLGDFSACIIFTMTVQASLPRLEQQCATFYEEEAEDTCDRSQELFNGCLLDEDPRCETWAKEGKCLDSKMIISIKNTSQSSNVKQYPRHNVDTLAKCVPSCTRTFSMMKMGKLLTPEEKLFANILGLSQNGLDTKNIFGHRYNVCNLTLGWTYTARSYALFHTVKAHLSFHSDVIPRLTNEGISKRRVPSEVWRAIVDATKNETLHPESTLREGFIWRSRIVVDDFESREDEEEDTVPVPLRMLLPQGRVHLGSLLLPYAQEWIGGGVDLSFSALYGVRRYLRGSVMVAHTDILREARFGVWRQCLTFRGACADTHVISAIVNFGQYVDSPWPLQIMDHSGVKHEVFLNKGEMLWYESSKLPHARNIPLDGTYFDNIFFHYRPTKDNVSVTWSLDGVRRKENETAP